MHYKQLIEVPRRLVENVAGIQEDEAIDLVRHNGYLIADVEMLTRRAK